MTSDGDLSRKEFEEKVKDFYKKKYRQAYIGSDQFIFIHDKIDLSYTKILISQCFYFRQKWLNVAKLKAQSEASLKKIN